MDVSEAIGILQDYISNEFEVETQKSVNWMVVPLYGKRKAGLGGHDYLFIHDFDEYPQQLSDMKRMHEEARKYVNAFYKVPKALRLKVPNIVTLFVSSKGFDEEMQKWVEQPTRSAIGGEIHSICLIDINLMCSYGQDISRTRVTSGTVRLNVEFKEIDPQNRTFYLLNEMMKQLQKTTT